MNPIVTGLLTLIQYAPAAIKEINDLYTAVRADLSSTDQVTIDTALKAAQDADAAATSSAVSALDKAAQR